MKPISRRHLLRHAAALPAAGLGLGLPRFAQAAPEFSLSTATTCRSRTR